MLKKLRIQFVCVLMAIFTLMLCGIFVTVYAFTARNLEQHNIQKLEAIANRPLLSAMGNTQDRESYILFQSTPNGGWVSRATGDFAALEDEDLQNILRAALAAEKDTGILNTYNLRFLVQTSSRRQTVAFCDVTAELTTLNLLLQIGLLIGGIGLLVFFGISLLLAYVMVRPVEKAWKQQHQFVADASHELKTPLTVVMTNAELLQDPDFEASEKQRFSENILIMTRQMRGLVNSLLELARVDNGAIKTTFVPVDLSEALMDAILPFEPLFFEKDLQLHSHIDSSIYTKGSVSHLRQVAEILLDNAMKYSDPGIVEVSLRKTGGHCLFTVSNPGAPIPAEDLKHLFERFYRQDKSRSRDGSYGLGLSIAQRIVQEHHGKIWAESANGHNLFHVSLPVTGRPTE